jgi:hypothetical protein
MQRDNVSSVIPKEDLEAATNNNTVKGILTRVFKYFLVSFGKDITSTWNQLMDKYVTDPTNNIPNDRSKQTSAKGNAKREYLAPQLSFAKFCEAMRFAQFKRLDIIFIAEDEKGEVMSQRETLNFESIPSEAFKEDLVEQHVSRGIPKFGMDRDAREMAKKGNKKPLLRGKDWTQRPIVDTDSVIEDNTVRTIGTKINDNEE